MFSTASHSVKFSCSVMSDFATSWTAALQASLSIINSQSLFKFMPIESVMPPNHPISFSRLQSFPASGSFPMSQFFVPGGQSIKVQLQHQSFQWIFRVDFFCNWLIWSPWSPSDSQESSPTPQFKSTNSSVPSFLYRPTLASIHDHRKNHSFDRMDLCQQSNALLFTVLSRLVIAFLPRSKCLLISWLQVTMCSDFGNLPPSPRKKKNITASH